MKDFLSILVVVPPGASQATIHHLVLNSMRLGKWMKSNVHFLVGTSDAQAVDTTIGDLKDATPINPPGLIIHTVGHTAGNSTALEVIEKYSCSLVVLRDGVVLHPSQGTDERAILELSPIPVLLFPKDFDFGDSTPRGFLVPLSGEQRTSEALSTSLRLAEITNSTVDLLHVLPEEPSRPDEDIGNLGDQLHHEYSQMAEKIATEASPYSSAQERGRIRHILHCTGLVTTEIAKILHESPGAILTLEWKGSLAEGRAATVKNILQIAHYPILLVKEVHEERSTLCVGRNIRAV